MLNSDELLQELLQTFQMEATEHLQTLNMSLLSLEVRPEESIHREMIQEAFRAAHSLKGAARVVGLDSIEHLSHGMENVLQNARDMGVHLADEAYNILYDTLDAIGLLLENKPIEVEQLLKRLSTVPSPTGVTTALKEHPSQPIETPKTAEAAIHATAKRELPTVTEPSSTEDLIHHSASSTTVEETIRVSISKLDNLMAQVGELLVSRMNAEQRADEMQEIRQHMVGWAQFWRELKVIQPQIGGDIGNHLMEVVARYQNEFHEAAQDVSHLDQSLRQDARRLGILVSQLQDNVRRVRLVPFETIVPGLQRTVRDAAHSESKQVAFHVVGSEVELDKKVLEALKDPFLHLLRNAVGHGIESPAIRAERGKALEGQIILTLQQRGAEVHITIQDDGAGFDLDGLRRAHQDPNDVERTTQKDIIEIAFLPGITTSPGVTAISGRGVGLDVVRQRLEVLQGRIEVDSNRGRGASIRLVVPVTLAISRVLILRVGSECYGLPLLSVLKIVEPQESFTVEGQTFVTVDGATLPLMELGALLERPVETETSSRQLIVIIAIAEQRRALVVDDVLTEQELAVKPLGKPLNHVRNVAGTALLSDGHPIVILNPADLIRSAKARGGMLTKSIDVQEIPQRSAHILVVDDSITTRTLEKNILETAGYIVTTALDGEQALLRMRENLIDLVVSDVQMPNMDGIGLVRSIRNSEEFGDLPVILVTSLESQEDRERGMVAGADAYIVKRGFDQAELLKAIQQLIYIGD